jgi:hypothetical protein
MHQIDLVKISLPLKEKFRVSKGEADVKTNYLVIFNNRYIGEASSSVFYGPSLDEIETDLRSGINKINQLDNISLETLETVSKLEINSISRSALVALVLNYISGESKRYPWEIVNLGTPVGIKSSFTIGIDKAEKMIENVKSSEYPIIKIKLGYEDDKKIIDALDDSVKKQVRVDANGAWSCAKAEEMIYSLANKGIKVIEQPTGIEFIEEWPHIKGKNKDVELILDEGMNNVKDFEKYSSSVDGINIKMEKCGGIIEAIKIANAAKEDGKKIMLGCMVESSVGIAQSVYMSSMADYYDLDGPLLLENDIASGIKYNLENIEVDREIIGGPKLNREIFEKYISK